MVLDDVTNSARLIIKSPSSLDTKVLGHRDLHTLNMVAIPEWFQDRIGETEKKHVVHRPLTQVMVDAKDGLLVEGAEQSLVELLRRDKIVAERLLDDDASAVGALSFTELFYDCAEQYRRNGEVERWLLRRAQLLTQSLKGRKVFVITVDI